MKRDVGDILKSLEDEVDEGAEAAWEAEIASRIKELDSGKVKTIPYRVPHPTEMP